MAKNERQLKRPGHLFSEEDARRICDVGHDGLAIISATGFKSQDAFKHSRSVRHANILNDYFEKDHFAGKRILELGPGHYAFALLARHLGAEVICVEREASFIRLGCHLGFKVVDRDFTTLSPADFDRPFDGLWVKGTPNGCSLRSDEALRNFIEGVCGLIKPDGWGWWTMLNRVAASGEETKDDQAFVDHRIEVERAVFLALGWTATPVDDADRPLYALKYRGMPYVFSRGIPAYPTHPGST